MIDVLGARHPEEDRGETPGRASLAGFGEVVAHRVLVRIAAAVPGAWRGLSGGEFEQVRQILADEAERIERLGPPIARRRQRGV